nr:LysR substrate-binding domain-containing protein [Streptomyces colonosanans]
MNGLVRGKLVVGMVTACTVTPLFDALSGFRLARPGVEISLIEDDSGKLVEYVREGAVDLALIGAAGRAPEDLDGWQIISEPIVAAMPDGHPLAERGRVTLAELSAYPIICMPEGTGIRAVLDQASAACGVTPTIALQASAPGSVLNLAERGLGVAVLSESMIAQHQGLRAVAITDADVPAILALISAPTKSAALRELLLHCRQSSARPGPTVGRSRRAGRPPDDSTTGGGHRFVGGPLPSCCPSRPWTGRERPFWRATQEPHPAVRGMGFRSSAGQALHLHLPTGSGASFLGPPTHGRVPGVLATSS